MVQRLHSVQELPCDALMARVWLGQGLLSLDHPEQLLQVGAILQGMGQAHGNVCHMDGHQVVVYCSIASP